MRQLLLGIVATIILVSSGRSADGFSPDAIFVNGKIWTVDRARPEAQALAVWRDRIVGLGSTDDVRNLAGPATKVIDLQGRRIVTGFYDSHVHLLGSGLQISRVDLEDAADDADEAEFGKRLVAFDRKMPRDRW